MGENELFKDKIEVSLDGRQIFYLFFGGAIIASLVFVLGVMVGKRLESRAHIHTTADTSAATDPLAALDKLAGTANQLTFPSALAGNDADPLAKVDRALSARIKEQQESAGGAPQEQARKQRVQEADRKRHQADKLADKRAAQKRLAEKRESEKRLAEKRAADKRLAEKRAAEKRLAEKREAEARVRREPDERDGERDGDPARGVETAAAGGTDSKESQSKSSYTLQLSSFRDKAEADAFFQQLSRAGYEPYLIEAKVKGRAWYRVRLGRYSSYSDAIEAKARFEKKQRIIAYVTRVRG